MVDFESVRLQAANRQQGKGDERDKARDIAALAKLTEKNTNGFLVATKDNGSYLFDGITKRLIPLYDGKQIHPELAALLFKRYDLLGSERITQHVVAAFDAWARGAEHQEVHCFSYYDKKRNILYLSRYNGTVYRLDGKNISIIDNGREVLFLDDNTGLSVEADIGPHGLLKGAIVDDLEFVERTAGGLTPKMQAVLLYIWLHALPFTNAFGARPVLLLEGPRGSGKTTAIQRIQRLVLGKDEVHMLGDNRKDFLAALSRRTIALVDNADSFVDWLADIIASVTNKGRLMARKLYTNNDESSIGLTGWLTVTSRNPISLQRDDVVDRTIILRMNRRKEFTSTTMFLDRVDKQRHKLYGEWLFNLNKIIEQGFSLDGSSKTRMAEFGIFGERYGHVIGLTQDSLQDAFSAAEEERGALVEESEALVPVIDHWLLVSEADKAPYGDPRHGVVVRQLYVHLSKLASDHGLFFPWKSDLSLARHIVGVLPGLERQFVVERIVDRKTGVVKYRFDRK